MGEDAFVGEFYTIILMDVGKMVANSVFRSLQILYSLRLQNCS